MKTLSSSLFILLIAIQVYAQDSDELILLQAKAYNYYNQGNYSNAIIVFEDLLAEQETAYGKDDIRVGETLNRLGEMYSIMGMPDIADYYFQQAIIIFKNSFFNNLEGVIFNGSFTTLPWINIKINLFWNIPI